MIKIIAILTLCFLSVSSDKVCKHNLLGSGVTSADEQSIVDTHNKLRNIIALGDAPNQPKAANMLKVVYDAKLAEAAQKLADKCEFDHTPIDQRNIPGLGTFGQNLAYNTYDAKNFSGAIESWYNEVVKPGYPPANCAPKSDGVSSCPTDDTGHYTQIAWAETNKVGCGYTYYEEKDEKKHLYVCNYIPAGNYPDTTVYLFGDPASKCPPNTAKDSQYPGLCSATSG